MPAGGGCDAGADRPHAGTGRWLLSLPSPAMDPKQLHTPICGHQEGVAMRSSASIWLHCATVRPWPKASSGKQLPQRAATSVQSCADEQARTTTPSRRTPAADASWAAMWRALTGKSGESGKRGACPGRRRARRIAVLNVTEAGANAEAHAARRRQLTAPCRRRRRRLHVAPLPHTGARAGFYSCL